MGFQKFRSGLWMKRKALQQSNNQADSIGAGKFQVGRWTQLAINLNDFLKQNGNGSHTVPQENWQIIEGLSFSTE